MLGEIGWEGFVPEASQRPSGERSTVMEGYHVSVTSATSFKGM